MRAVLDHFGPRQAALVVLSMGGETVLGFALTRPERVTALALVCASVSGHVWPQSPESSAYAAGRRERETATLAELELAIWAAMGRTAPGGKLIESIVASNAKRRVVSEQHCVVSAGRDAEPHLGEIAAPTLVIHGE
ncbi:alpha/beta fold hydrolase [Streptomyces sp. NPDC002004]